MTKTEAISIFGTVKELARAYGCERQAIYQWPETLPQGIADRVVGAAFRAQKHLFGPTPGIPPEKEKAA